MKDLQFLYLVSCEKEGEGYWRIGTTDNTDPLQESKNFIECYRKELIGIIAAKKIISAIEINLKNLLNDCIEDGFNLENPSEGISYDIPLNIIEEIYDFWLNLYQDVDIFDKVISLLLTRKKVDFSNPSIYKALKGFTAKWALTIEKLHSYRPPSKKIYLPKEPMWIDNDI